MPEIIHTHILPFGIPKIHVQLTRVWAEFNVVIQCESVKYEVVFPVTRKRVISMAWLHEVHGDRGFLEIHPARTQIFIINVSDEVVPVVIRLDFHPLSLATSFDR
jgi:hypothetical protein